MDLHKLLFEESSRTKAKKKIRELERKIEEYKALYEDYQVDIDEIDKAKTYAYTACKEVKDYIDSLANKPKEIDTIILTQKYELENFDGHVNLEKRSLKKNIDRNSRTVILNGAASVLFLPYALIGLPVMIHSAKKEDKNNEKVIKDCEEKIKEINREIHKIRTGSNEVLSEYEFLITYSDNLKSAVQKLKSTGIQNYLEFSIEEKGELGALVNSLQALINRIGAK